jgi:hypothetical protein
VVVAGELADDDVQSSGVVDAIVKLKDLEKRLKAEPNNLGLRVQVAGMMREAGRSLEAVELYRSVALAYRDQGRTQQAIAVCRSILEIAPEDAACHGLLGVLQSQSRATPAPSRTSTSNLSRPSASDLLRRQSQAKLEPHNPVSRPGSSTRERMASTPRGGSSTGAPPSRAGSQTASPQRSGSTTPPPPSVPRAATMRQSPMPPAPEVPTLRPATAPVAPSSRAASVGRPATTPPAIGRSVTRDKPLPRPHVIDQHDAPRRSSLDSTPLPAPVPYHVADRTSQPDRLSDPDPRDSRDTRPDMTPSGLAHAARHITGAMGDSRTSREMDLARELDTRQRPRVDPDELDKIAKPPPTGQMDRVDYEEDTATPAPRSSDDLLTSPQRSLSPTPRGSDDALTPPRRSSASLPRIGTPPRSPSRPPSVLSIPPKTRSRPPGVISIPPKHDSRPPGSGSDSRPPGYGSDSIPPAYGSDSRPPGYGSDSQPPGGTDSQPPTTIHDPRVPGTLVGRIRPPAMRGAPPPRPAMPKIPRESNDEITRPRDKRYDGSDDDDD